MRRKVEVRREEILDAAVLEVGRSGFARLRVTDVAAALGCSSALVFYHFETKDRLLAEAFEHAVEGDLARLAATVARGRDATDKVRRILRLYAPQGAAPGWTAAGRRLGGGPAHAATSAPRHAAWTSAGRRSSPRCVAEGVAEGTFTCADPRQPRGGSPRSSTGCRCTPRSTGRRAASSSPTGRGPPPRPSSAWPPTTCADIATSRITSHQPVRREARIGESRPVEAERLERR